MEFQELTPQEMEQVNGGGLLGGGLVGGLLGGLLGSNCNNSCNNSCSGIDVKVKLSIGICL